MTLLEFMTILVILIPIAMGIGAIVMSLESAKIVTKNDRLIWYGALTIVSVVCSVIIYIQQYMAAAAGREQAKIDTAAEIAPLSMNIKNLQEQDKELGIALAQQAEKTSHSEQVTTPAHQIGPLKRVPSSPPPVSGGALTQAPPPTPQITIEGPLPTGRFANISFVQRSTVSTNAAEPYSTQVIIQTSATISEPAFAVLTDGTIDDGDFFVTGNGAMMNVMTGTTGDRKTFVLKFSYPSFTPESPIVVTLHSKTPMKVLAVQDARGKI